ncbi:NACHT domain-containing protein [Actinophytocola sediminis]
MPAALAAAILEHNDTHLPGESFRLRMAVHAGEVHHDDYGVVAEAVNLAFRLLDSRELKDVLTDSTGVLALITSDWFYREVVRHCLDGDPTAYHRVRVMEKETDTTAWIHVPGDRSHHDHAPTVADNELWAVSDRSTRRLGARRTAYPLDLSIAELHERGVYVPATFSDLTGDTRSADVDFLTARLEGNRSVLILGEPGSGKSVAAYALLAQLRRRTPAVAARVSELRTALDPATAGTALATALRRPSTDAGQEPVLVIDGLDETISGFATVADLADLLGRLGERFSMVVTCRRREFEDLLAHSIDSSTFDSIYTIDTWTLDHQFTEFVSRLVSSGLLESAELLAGIRDSPGLARMIERPLYARMLTFLGQDGLAPVTNVCSLYAEYIDKLATASDGSLAAAGCRLPIRSLDLWIGAAWQIFSRRMLSEDRFDFDAVTTVPDNADADQLRCRSRALSQICDQWRAGGRVYGRFVHYSFFEYLVSRHYMGKLKAALSAGPDALTDSLSLDLSPEIRHFLVDELRENSVFGLAGVMEDAYLRLRTSTPRSPRARTAGNLVAYLLSRAVADGRAALRRLLDGETDVFLQQSLLWGLCHLGDNDALTRFVRETRSSARWRAWNRGYVMYYYGDIDRSAEPPYVDSDPERSWGRTRERSIAMMSSAGYRDTVAAQRRYLDLYLLYDYAIWRGQVLTGIDAQVAGSALADLWREPGIAGSLLQELQASHAIVCRPAP